MIQLIAYTPSDKIEEELKHLYFTSFPADERRDWEQLIELMNHQNFNLYKILKDDILAGIISIWQWNDLTFIEHFAIIESLRNKGIGKQVIELIIKENSSSIILEVDEPTTETAKRRIDFYNRLDFIVCQETYYQPPYHTGNKPVKMILMTYPQSITQNKFNLIKERLYKEVYQWNIISFP